MIEGSMGIPKYKSKPKRKLIPPSHRPLSSNRSPITEDTPLSLMERKFLDNFIQSGDPAWALEQTGLFRNNRNGYRNTANKILQQPNIQAELKKIMDEIRDNTVMDAHEVMQYFTAVARGEVKDQFGLDAPLSERTRAAIEIAKRTADIDLKKELRQEALDAPVVAVKLLRD